VNLPIGRESEAYRCILPYLATLDSAQDNCRNIWTFYDAINHHIKTSYDYPLADPYSIPLDLVSPLRCCNIVIEIIAYTSGRRPWKHGVGGRLHARRSWGAGVERMHPPLKKCGV